MTSVPGIRAHPLPIDILENLGPGAAQLGRRELAGALAPLVEGLREPLPEPERAVAGEAVMAFCRRLYSGGRSGDALPLGAALLAQAIAAPATPCSNAVPPGSAACSPRTRWTS